ncbi:MAG: hypothetical protein D6694_01900, partial [Gammaproteobacteria bacterium]
MLRIFNNVARHIVQSGLIVLFGIVMIVPSNAAVPGPVTGQSMTLQPAGSASFAQMQQAASVQSLAPAYPRVRIVPKMEAPTKDLGSFLLPTPAQTAKPSPLAALPQPSAPAASVTGFQALLDNLTAIPPDTMGAVGPNHLMTMLNSQVRIQNKAGGIIQTVSLTAFWTAPTTGLNGTPFDPHVIYDTLSGRWIAACAANGKSANSQIWLAVSATSDPTGVWHFYSFIADATGTNWADYPGLGVNSKWIAITANMFPVAGGAIPGIQMWVIDKSTALNGGALTVKNFAPGFTNNSTMIPAVVRDAAEPNLYFVNTGFSANQKTVDLIA